jgi:S1-C subfamily serine protease
MKRTLVPVVVVSALLGAALSVGTVELLDLGGGGDRDGRTTTVVQQAPLSTDRPAGGEDGEALTARDIYKRDAPGVVFIRAEIVQREVSPFGLPSEQRGEATGSGFVIDRDGTILTNAHVVQGAREVRVTFQDKRVVDAKVLGADPSTDLAVLKVDPKGLSLRPLALGSSKDVQVGDPTIAIGNPFGLERTLTTGVVSATKRTILGLDDFQIDNVIQTDAAINPGNSGGPLLDAAGRVIGINSQIRTGGDGTGSSSGGSVGIGFAVPIDTAKRIVPQLKSAGRVDRGYLGIETRTIDRSLDDLDLPVTSGALVQRVTSGGPADEAGIRGGNVSAELDGEPIAIGGDIITAIDGKRMRTSQDVAAAVTRKQAGDRVKVELLRDGKKRTVDVRLDRRPVSASAQQQP